MAEQRGFVFAVTFIIVFSALLASIPVGLQGQGETPDNIDPVFPIAIAGFSDSEAFLRDNFTANSYEYSLNDREWLWITNDAGFAAGAKILVLDIFWFGGMDVVEFIDDGGGTNRGEDLTLIEIDADDSDGTASYNMNYKDIGGSAGTAIFYWNTTEYANSTDAWLDDGLYILHGIGFDSSATSDAGSLLMSLLTLSVPDVPELVQILLLAPIFACVVYLIWYIIKEMIPFV